MTLHSSRIPLIFSCGRVVTVALLTLLFAAFVTDAQAAPINLVQNGGFEQTSLTTTDYVCAQNGSSTCTSRVAHWDSTCAVFGCVPDGHDVLFLETPDDINGFNSGAGLGGSVTTSPDGGNFISGDGDPQFSAPLFQTISGLTPGASYLVSFYQAATEQAPGPFTTTSQWQVSLGSEVKDSALMTKLPDTWVPWEFQTLSFTATAASEVLSFLAVGTPAGAPPVSLLDGVSLTASISSVPEPTSWALLATGLLAMIGVAQLRRRKADR